MNVYLVGGAVRDQLLNFPVIERDWVVVGQTPEQMLNMGFKAVGKDFPVFLHPATHDEYALARTERKTAPGYKGFAINAAPGVTLREDLKRRDLTINAMAMLPDGLLFDPFGGQRDLQAKLLRHVSPAFSEDPVRILRVARFAARFAHLGFHIAAETLQLMQQMVQHGEIDHLVPERVWAETHKALKEQSPSAYFLALQRCGALKIIFPEIDQLFGVPQPEQYHPEIDTGIHSLLALEQAALLTTHAEVRFAALVHDLGKACTPARFWPGHHGHETAGLPLLTQLCQRLRVPKQFHKLASRVMQFHTHCHRSLQLRPSTLVDMLQSLGALKTDRHFSHFLLACEADAKGRTGLENKPYPQADFIRQARQAAITANFSAMHKHLRGAQIGQAIREQRIKAVQSFKQTYASKHKDTSPLSR